MSGVLDVIVGPPPVNISKVRDTDVYFAIGMIIALILLNLFLEPKGSGFWRFVDQERARTARGLVRLAALLAGPRKAGGQEEWLANLAGPSEDGRPLSIRAQFHHALGVVWAALHMRLRDLVRRSGRGLDWILSTDERVAVTILGTTASAMVDLIRNGGLISVLQNGENLACIAGGLWGGAVLLRRIRGVTAIPRAPRKRQDDELERE